MDAKRFFGAVLFAVAIAAPSPGGAAGGDPLAALAVYAGTWRLHIDHVRTEFSRARAETMIVKNVCWRSTDYYACNQIVDGNSAALVVFTHAPDAKQYTSTTIVPNGAPHTGSLAIDGATWTYPWQETDAKGKLVYLRVVNTFTGPGAIAYRQEFSRDKRHWTVTARGLETKQS